MTFASGSGNGATESATISPSDDNLVEGDEDVRLDLAYSSGAATLGAQDSHTVTIQDADLASVEFALAASSAGENAGGHNVVVNLNIAAGVTLQDAATFSVSAVDIDTTGDRLQPQHDLRDVCFRQRQRHHRKRNHYSGGRPSGGRR